MQEARPPLQDSDQMEKHQFRSRELLFCLSNINALTKSNRRNLEHYHLRQEEQIKREAEAQGAQIEKLRIEQEKEKETKRKGAKRATEEG